MRCPPSCRVKSVVGTKDVAVMPIMLVFPEPEDLSQVTVKIEKVNIYAMIPACEYGGHCNWHTACWSKK